MFIPDALPPASSSCEDASSGKDVQCITSNSSLPLGYRASRVPFML